MDTFKLKSGKEVKVDFTNSKSILSIKKSNWVEIKQQLDKQLEIVCSQLSGKEVYELLKNK